MTTTKMKKEEILTEAIVKAVKNGYYPDLKGKAWEVNPTSKDCELLVYGCKHDKKDYWRYDSKTIIFSQDFAEAFAKYILKSGKDYLLGGRFVRGKEPIGLGYEMRVSEIKKMFLQQMILEKDPILYLKKFLKEEHE